MVQKKIPRHFIRYNHDDFIRPLCIKLPQMIGYIKCFDTTKTMSFKVIDNELLRNFSKICGRAGSLMNIKFDSQPVYGNNDKYIKTKINLYENKVNTNFQGK